MRIIKCFFIFTVFLQIIIPSAADETLRVSLYYPCGYMWLGPYEVVPVLSLYVVQVSHKTARPERLTTPAPATTPSGPATSTTPASTTSLASTSSPASTTTPRRGDN